jgi:S1-C subfamily serine protease
VDGAPVTLRDNLSDLISRHAEGDKVKLEVVHHGQRKTMTVTLGKRPLKAPKT